MIRRTEVRCCCDGKLLGYLRVDEFTTNFIFPLTPTYSEKWNWQTDGQPTINAIERSEIKLSARMFSNGGRQWRCLSSNHTDIEDLRRIPGWEDAFVK